ncbi:MAG: phosphate:acyl-(acyl carrier protein) acyltransferase [Frankiales bacterium]|nr:phosphate:acyl-(acyl carrier protein) acyltransferase [Frankiales bacterium]
MTRVALDLLGGDHAPESIVDGAILVAGHTPDVEVLLVGPVDVAERLLAERGASGRFRLVAASQVIGMDEDPARAVRKKRDATVRVAARLVRDGEAEAMVSVGSTGAALAAGVFTLGRLRGVSRPALAAIIPAAAGPLVFLDAGAGTDATPELLAQFALAGVALAQVRLGIANPRVGLLSIGEEPGKGDELRRQAHPLLAALPVEFVGNVEGRDVPHGGRADVVVTDGFTGNVLAKGLEGAATMLRGVLLQALTTTPEREQASRALLPVIAEATAAMGPDELGGAVLLGVGGVVVIGHGASTPQGVQSCVRTAVQAAREGLVPRIAEALSDLLDRTRAEGVTA